MPSATSACPASRSRSSAGAGVGVGGQRAHRRGHALDRPDRQRDAGALGDHVQRRLLRGREVDVAAGDRAGERDLQHLREPLRPQRGVAELLGEHRVERAQVEQRLVHVEGDQARRVHAFGVPASRVAEEPHVAIGFHASHEQVHPRELLRAVRRAEEAGFDAAMCSDHFAPWSERAGPLRLRVVLARRRAAATTDLPFGVVNAPGQRYHPAVIAQAIATLDAMFPGRLLGGARQRRGGQRAHHRRRLAAQGAARRRGCASASR